MQICGDDAYETYSVPTPERCLLGRNITMTRRKADSACFNGKGWQRPQGWNVSCDCDWVSPICRSICFWGFTVPAPMPWANKAQGLEGVLPS